jgi:two-component system, chemotaxis family, sensor kinase CheA
MDELLREFLTETAESLDHVDAQLVRFEREPDNGQVLSNVFRLVHTIKVYVVRTFRTVGLAI